MVVYFSRLSNFIGTRSVMAPSWASIDQSSSGYVFTLPVESELDDTYSDVTSEASLIEVEVSKDGAESVPQVKQKSTPKKRKKPKRFSKLSFTWRMIRWHIILFAAITCGLYAVLHYGFDKRQKKVILEALSFCDDWKQLAFFFGIYLSFAVKKVSDVTSVSFDLECMVAFLGISQI